MVYSVFKQHIYTCRAKTVSLAIYWTAGLTAVSVRSEQVSCFILLSFTIDSVGMIYSDVYAVSCTDVRSAVFRERGRYVTQACMRRYVSEQSVRHITCPKQPDETKVY